MEIHIFSRIVVENRVQTLRSKTTAQISKHCVLSQLNREMKNNRRYIAALQRSQRWKVIVCTIQLTDVSPG